MEETCPQYARDEDGVWREFGRLQGHHVALPDDFEPSLYDVSEVKRLAGVIRQRVRARISRPSSPAVHPTGALQPAPEPGVVDEALS